MAVYEHPSLQRAMLNQQIEAAEHVLHQFCQPAYLRYHNPEDRIGRIHAVGAELYTTVATHLQYAHNDTLIEVPLIDHVKLQDQLELFRYLAGPFYNCQVHNRGGGPSPSACEQLRKCFEGLLRYENDMHLHNWARHINIIDPPMSHWTATGDLQSYELSGYRGNCPTNLFQVFADGEAPIGLRGFWITWTLNRRWQGVIDEEASVRINFDAFGVAQNYLEQEREGWSPVINVVEDGDRVVLQVVDWVDGQGPKPEHTGYMGYEGLVDNISQACDMQADPTSQWQWNPQHIDHAEAVRTLVEACHTANGGSGYTSAPTTTVTDKDKDTEAFIAEIDALMAEEDTDELPEEGTLPKAAPTG